MFSGTYPESVVPGVEAWHAPGVSGSRIPGSGIQGTLVRGSRVSTLGGLEASQGPGTRDQGQGRVQGQGSGTRDQVQGLGGPGPLGLSASRSIAGEGSPAPLVTDPVPGSSIRSSRLKALRSGCRMPEGILSCGPRSPCRGSAVRLAVEWDSTFQRCAMLPGLPYTRSSHFVIPARPRWGRRGSLVLLSPSQAAVQDGRFLSRGISLAAPARWAGTFPTFPPVVASRC